MTTRFTPPIVLREVSLIAVMAGCATILVVATALGVPDWLTAGFAILLGIAFFLVSTSRKLRRWQLNRIAVLVVVFPLVTKQRLFVGDANGMEYVIWVAFYMATIFLVAIPLMFLRAKDERPEAKRTSEPTAASGRGSP
jgi:hypothetical protein